MAEKNFVVSKNVVAQNVPTFTETTISTNSETTVASFPLSDFDTVEFTVKATQGDRRYSSKALALHNGTTVDLSQYGELSIAATEAAPGTGAVVWTTQDSGFVNTYPDGTITSVAYGNGTWVAAGYTGNIRTSTDAVTWITQTSNFGNRDILSVSFGSNLWVAVGGSLFGGYGQIRTSTDAITWVTRTSNLSSYKIQSVAYGNNLWVAAAYDQIRTSTDAITWATQTSNIDVQIYSVAYGNGLWVIAGQSGELRTSTDAITWVTRTSNFGNSVIASVAFGNNLWVAGGTYGQLRTSTDAITWVTQTSNFGNTGITSVAYGNNLWVGVGYYGELRTSGVDTQAVEIPLTLSADISGSDVRLRATISDAATTNAEVKVLKTTL